MVIDLARCKNLRKCHDACEAMHHCGPEKEFLKVLKMQDNKLAAPFWQPTMCFHCDEPPCVKVCPVDATYKRSDGIVLYYGNMVVDTRDKENFVSGTDRLSYFHQLIIARKITDKFSAQIAPSLSYYNNVEGYLDENGDIQKKMENAHFAIAFTGRYKITESMAILAGVDQPLTQHTTNNPYPNICFGLEIATSSHAFQVFAGNFSSIVPQSNNVFNQNDYENGQFLIGFNITKLWNW
jgi:ferredoxin